MLCLIIESIFAILIFSSAFSLVAGSEKETVVIYVADVGPKALVKRVEGIPVYKDQLAPGYSLARRVEYVEQGGKITIVSESTSTQRIPVYPCGNITISGPQIGQATWVELRRLTYRDGKVIKREAALLCGRGSPNDPVKFHVGNINFTAEKTTGKVLWGLFKDAIVDLALGPMSVFMIPLAPFSWLGAAADPEATAYNGSISVSTYNMTNMNIIDTCNISGTIYFDANGIPGALTQKITIYDDGTISEPIEVSCYPLNISFSVYTVDSMGFPKGIFALNNGVYLDGSFSLLPSNTFVDIYLIPEESPLDPSYSVTHVSQVTDDWGNLPITYLWTPTSGYDPVYHIWVDANSNGIYENETDRMNSFTVKTSVGGIVVPVDKFGLLAPYFGLASTILVATVASAIYVKRVKRRKEKQ